MATEILDAVQCLVPYLRLIGMRTLSKAWRPQTKLPPFECCPCHLCLHFCYQGGSSAFQVPCSHCNTFCWLGIKLQPTKDEVRWWGLAGKAVRWHAVAGSSAATACDHALGLNWQQCVWGGVWFLRQSVVATANAYHVCMYSMHTGRNGGISHVNIKPKSCELNLWNTA